VVDFELEGIHWGIEMDSVEVVEKQYLRVTLATVAWALAFTGPADFDNHYISALGVGTVVLVEKKPEEYLRDNMPFKFIEPGIDLAVVQLFATLADAPEHQRLGIEGRINTENIEGNAWCGAIISATDDITVADEE
jgi:hypothetical protein